MHIIPALQQAEAGLLFRAPLMQVSKACLKILKGKWNQKGWGYSWLKRSYFQSLAWKKITFLWIISLNKNFSLVQCYKLDSYTTNTKSSQGEMRDCHSLEVQIVQISGVGIQLPGAFYALENHLGYLNPFC